MRGFLVVLAAALAVMAAGCVGTDVDDVAATASAETSTSPTEASSPGTDDQTSADEADTAALVASAEALIEEFYSYDREALEAALGSSPSAAFVLYYQGWAEGANYGIVQRMPCEAASVRLVTCSITVEDDLVKALGIERDTTDTFSIEVDADGSIGVVSLGSDDLPEYREALEAVLEDNPDLFGPGAACEGFYDGGPTPGDCARAVVDLLTERAG